MFDDKVKRIGDSILSYVRSEICKATKEDANLEFKLRRWIYSRLQLDERKKSKAIKKELWDSGMRSCQACGEEFPSIKGVEIHRKNEDFGYSVENCELLHRQCHQEKA